MYVIEHSLNIAIPLCIEWHKDTWGCAVSYTFNSRVYQTLKCDFLPSTEKAEKGKLVFRLEIYGLTVQS